VPCNLDGAPFDLNTGSLRLNYNVPKGPLTRRHVEQLLPYATALKVVDVPGPVLRDQVLAHAIESWTGNGWFLQVSGIGFTHDPAKGVVRDVWIADGAGGRRPIRDDETIKLVTTDYLLDPSMGNRDGYTMIDPTGATGDLALKPLVLTALAAGPVAPVADGRICNTDRGACP
jgi:2',3'-cyclic-nucleotide 2'-phosphodiesterase (5'-nucleotidase family)